MLVASNTVAITKQQRQPRCSAVLLVPRHCIASAAVYATIAAVATRTSSTNCTTVAKLDSDRSLATAIRLWIVTGILLLASYASDGLLDRS